MTTVCVVRRIWSICAFDQMRCASGKCAFDQIPNHDSNPNPNPNRNPIPNPNPTLNLIIIIIQHLYSAIMSYADTEALVAPVKSE